MRVFRSEGSKLHVCIQSFNTTTRETKSGRGLNLNVTLEVVSVNRSTL